MSGTKRRGDEVGERPPSPPAKKARTSRWDNGPGEKKGSEAAAVEGVKKGVDTKSLMARIAAQKKALQKKKVEQESKLKAVQVEKEQKLRQQKEESERKAAEAARVKEIQARIQAQLKAMGGRVNISQSNTGGEKTMLAINKRMAEEKDHESKLFLDAPPEIDPASMRTLDPRVALPSATRQRRQTFRFTEPGTHARRADRIRHQANLVALEAEVANQEKDEMADVGLMAMVKEAQEKRKIAPIVDVEWWDAPFVGESYDNAVDVTGGKTVTEEVSKKTVSENGSAQDVEMGDAEATTSSTSAPVTGNSGEVSTQVDATPGPSIATNLVTAYVQHPVLLDPPTASEAPPPMPMILTKKERKKWRRLNRLEAQKEEQTKILLGLVPPPKPRVRIANLYRVLGQEAIQDPTAIERDARKQMAERQFNHDKRNQDRKLTPEERKEKTKKKLQEDTSKQVHVAVYCIRDLSNPKHKYKVDVNAKQNYLTGVCIVHPQLTLVVVEGGPKGLNRYKKLMLNRIKWDESLEDEEDSEGEEGGASHGSGKNSDNFCGLVWEGTQLRRHFDDFKTMQQPSLERARKVLLNKNVAHYWDMGFTHMHSKSDQ